MATPSPPDAIAPAGWPPWSEPPNQSGEQTCQLPVASGASAGPGCAARGRGPRGCAAGPAPVDAQRHCRLGPGARPRAVPVPVPTPTPAPMRRPCGRRAPSAGPIAAGGRRTEERRRCCLGGSWNRDSSCRISPSWLCTPHTAPPRVRRKRGAREYVCKVRTLRGLAEAAVDILAVRSVQPEMRGWAECGGLAKSGGVRAFLGRLGEGANGVRCKQSE